MMSNTESRDITISLDLELLRALAKASARERTSRVGFIRAMLLERLRLSGDLPKVV